MNGYLLRAARRKDHLTILANAYYIGEVLEYRTQSFTERILCGQQLSAHYRIGCVNLFRLYEPLGIEQLYRTRRSKLWMFKSIKKPELDQLAQEAMMLTLD